MPVDGLWRISGELGDLERMESFVDHPGDVTAAGGAPCDPLADAGEVADFLQRPVDFLVDPFDTAIKFRLCRIAPFDSRKDIIHIRGITVTVDDPDRFVGQDYPCLLIEFRTVVDDHIVLYPIPCQQANIDGRHSAGIVAEQEQIEIKRFLFIEQCPIEYFDPADDFRGNAFRSDKAWF